MTLFESTLTLIFAAIVLLQLSRRLAIPYPTMLALAGVAVAALPWAPDIVIEPRLALALFIAATLVEGAQLARAGWLRYVDILAQGLWAIVTIALAAVLIVLPLRFGGQVSIAGILGAVVLLGLAAALLYRRPQPPLVAAFVGVPGRFAPVLVIPQVTYPSHDHSLP